jgi:uncharacterized membrane protein
MPIASAANTSTALERLSQIPMEFWLKFSFAVVAIIIAVLVLRKLAHVNKAVLAIVAGVFVTAMGFSWIYERNEPHWATPAVSFVADFFPSKGMLAQR